MPENDQNDNDHKPNRNRNPNPNDTPNKIETHDNEAGPTGASHSAEADRVARISTLNDRLRRTFEGGDIVMTEGVRALPVEEMVRVLRDVQKFVAFTGDNDPYYEHDCGSFERDSGRYIWKIDYFDLQRENASPDPADPAVTLRVLTVMRSEEY